MRSGAQAGLPKLLERQSEIRFAADYVEALNVRGNKFAHACPRCAERLRCEGDRSSKRWQVVKRGPVAPFVGERVPRCRLCKRPLVRIGSQQEGLFRGLQRNIYR